MSNLERNYGKQNINFFPFSVYVNSYILFYITRLEVVKYQVYVCIPDTARPLNCY